MAKPIRYYVARIGNRFGERELETMVRFKTRSGDPARIANGVAKTFWGTPDKPLWSDDPWYFNGGEVATWSENVKEVTEATFNDLQGIVTELGSTV